MKRVTGLFIRIIIVSFIIVSGNIMTWLRISSINDNSYIND